MRVVVPLIALLLTWAAGAESCTEAPDFGWGSSATARRLLSESEAAWKKASSLQLRIDGETPATVRIDGEKSLRGLVHRSDFTDLAFRLLDTSLRKESLLERTRTLYMRAASTPSAAPPGSAVSDLEEVIHREHSLTRLAVGVARAGAAVRMANQDSASYSFQAMESAIDALADSAREADASGERGMRGEAVRKLRSLLFSVWDSAQRAKDPSILAGLDLAAAFDQAFTESKSEQKPTDTSSIQRNTQQVAAASTPESLKANAPAVPTQHPRAVAA